MAENFGAAPQSNRASSAKGLPMTHFTSPIILLLATLFSASAIAAQAAATCPVAVKPVKNSDQAGARAAQIVEAYQLTSLARECLHFFVTEPGKGSARYQIVVRENHSGRCGGDPNTSPRVLSLEMTPDGQFFADSAAEPEMQVPRCPVNSKTKKG